MITFRQHIDMMKCVSNGENISDYTSKNLKPFEELDYYRSFDKTYPITENLKKPLFKNKYFLSIDSLILGQFIMLEQIITGKTKLPDHLVDYEISKLIIRPEGQEEFDNSYDDIERKNSEEILNLDVREVYWVLEKMISNRNKTLFEEFAGVFYEPQEEEEDGDEQDSTNDMLFNQQWYWYSIVRMLSGDDIHKYEQTYMLPMRTVLPEMSYLAQKSKIESANQRQQAALRKL